MPESQQPLGGQQAIIDELSKTQGQVILDIGAGSGRWGKLCGPLAKQIDGVEAWATNIVKHNLETIYHKVFASDIRKFHFEVHHHTVAILGDVLEHMPLEDGIALIERMQAHFQQIYLIIPVTVCVQDGHALGNPYETHHYHWSDREIRDLGFNLLRFDLNPNHLVVIGAYVWKRHKL